MAKNSAGISCITARSILARFHANMPPKGIATAIAKAKGVKAVLKNGGPTETVRSVNISITKGQIVPMNTTKVDTAKSRLFSTSPDSRLMVENTPLASIAPARSANSNSAPPMKKHKIIKIKTPRSGSLAKACTLVSTPERTMKVPISENPKARIARRIVQLFNASRFSTTMAECKSAAAISHGMSEAFSTGSQNQKPPQPNS